MKINSIVLNNFRQYNGNHTIDLSVNEEQNIILIGGQNGYGKTNFLVSLVWCIYGENIIKIDEKFKYAVQKEGNYPKFLKNSLNWSAEKEGITKFSVELIISEVVLPNLYESKEDNYYNLRIIRSFDINSNEDELEIEIEGISKKLFFNTDDKISFINDYLIPIEAARFVFFDAEKIANIAGLSTKEEGNLMNDALSKILGLDIYENLQTDIQFYCDNLKKESANSNLKAEITANENLTNLNRYNIGNFEEKILDLEIELEELKKEKKSLEKYLALTPINNLTNDLPTLLNKRDYLIEKSKEYETDFFEISESIPFAILSPKLEEIIDHLELQINLNNRIEASKKIETSSTFFIENLFNKEPFPSNDISLATKIFYFNKAQKLFQNMFGETFDSIELKFEHDINKSERELLIESYNFSKNQSRSKFETVFENFNSIENEILEIEKNIRKLNTSSPDDELINYSNKREDIEHKIEKNIEEKGKYISQIEVLKKSNDKLNLEHQSLLRKINVSEMKKNKLERANQYIKVLEEFISKQKIEKCSVLEKSIFSEMQQIMHKFKDDNGSDFISKVKVEILPPNDGLKVILFDKTGMIKPKEALLSEGEKQIYISSLIKSILALSTQEFPIIIDTPLARLDSNHINNFLQYYYPNLGKQVILLATDNEISDSRYKLIEKKVSKKYYLENKNSNSIFKTGYLNEN